MKIVDVAVQAVDVDENIVWTRPSVNDDGTVVFDVIIDTNGHAHMTKDSLRNVGVLTTIRLTGRQQLIRLPNTHEESEGMFVVKLTQSPSALDKYE